MTQNIVPIISLRRLTAEVHELTMAAPHIARDARPGQFVNIRVDDHYPLLRRPFSIFAADGERLSVVFTVIGTGTRALAAKRPGETLDVVGPCGNDFLAFEPGEYDTAVFVAGGIGVAPFPFLTRSFPANRPFVTYVGGRNSGLIVTEGLHEPHIATDDGSLGFHGTVVDLIRNETADGRYGKVRYFTCGPTRMMKALADHARSEGSACFASLETDMACGVGLCQGCNVERKDGPSKYALVCKEGTIFDTEQVVLR